MRNFELLLYLAKKSRFREIELSTIRIAKDFGTSQQTISRKLRELEADNLISRSLSSRGTRISLSPNSRKLLNQRFLELKGILGSQKRILAGKIISGLGEGKYYMSQPSYRKQFKEKLGFLPFEGTLNIQVSNSELVQTLATSIPIMISGFQSKDRTFGNIECYPIRINSKTKAVLIIPERTTNPSDVVEIISNINLRKNFNLKDGSAIKVEVL